jgi:hypothetical protein
MSSILKVDTLQDSGGNTILSSNGSGGFSNNLPAGKTSSFRNLIINGDMSIAQRDTQSTGQTNTDGYSTCDRFRVTNYIGTLTFDQETLTSGNAYNNGFKKAFKITVTSTEATPSAGDQLYLETRLEGQMLQQLKKGTSNAESLTLSFWVKSSKTGTNLQVNFRDIDNSRMISGTYDINSADTWEKKTITVAGDTTGALDNDNGGSFRIEWYLDSGSSSTGGTLQTSWAARSVADSNITNFDLGGATDNWAITGVQLEIGTTASDFEFIPHDVNLQRCMRYYQIYNYMGNPGSEFGYSLPIRQSSAGNKQWMITTTLPVPVRTSSATLSWDAARTGSAGSAYDGSWLYETASASNRWATPTNTFQSKADGDTYSQLFNSISSVITDNTNFTSGETTTFSSRLIVDAEL